jgi:hypothetical protein
MVQSSPCPLRLTRWPAGRGWWLPDITIPCENQDALFWFIQGIVVMKCWSKAAKGYKIIWVNESFKCVLVAKNTLQLHLFFSTMFYSMYLVIISKLLMKWRSKLRVVNCNLIVNQSVIEILTTGSFYWVRHQVS